VLEKPPASSYCEFEESTKLNPLTDGRPTPTPATGVAVVDAPCTICCEESAQGATRPTTIPKIKLAIPFKLSFPLATRFGLCTHPIRNDRTSNDTFGYRNEKGCCLVAASLLVLRKAEDDVLHPGTWSSVALSAMLNCKSEIRGFFAPLRMTKLRAPLRMTIRRTNNQQLTTAPKWSSCCEGTPGYCGSSPVCR
jgi:hypothetical protein